MELGESLLLSARRQPEKPAILYQDQAMSYATLFERASRLANAALAQGLPERANIGILMKNRPEFLELYFGLTMAGMIPTPLNYRLTVHDWELIARNSDLQLLFLEAEYADALDVLEGVVPRVVLVGDHPGPALPRYEEWLRRGSRLPPDRSRFSSTLMLNTSGTTGVPKGVVRSRFGFLERAVEQRFTPEDRFLAAMPLCLSAGTAYTLTTLFLGGTVSLMRDFEPDLALDLITSQRLTSSMMVPTMLTRLVEAQAARPRDVSSFQTMQGGAGELTAETKAGFIREFGEILSIYAASTEVGPYANLRPYEVLDHLEGNCVGRPFFGVELRLLKEGEEVPVGEVGEICARSPFQFDGYYKDAEATQACRRGEFLTVGDLGRLDANGYLWFVGRERDVIKTGGINVFASEVEQVLLEHPAVADVAVVGLPDPVWTEAIAAAVVPEPGCSLTADEVIHFAQERLASYKKPRYVLLVEEIPRNLTGRVLKQQVKDRIESWRQSEARTDHMG